MSMPASSLNWWYMLGSFRLMCSSPFGMRDLIQEMSRNTPPCGLPRPSRISRTMQRETWSRVSSSGGRRAALSPWQYRHPSSSSLAVCPAYSSGMFSNMNRLPSRLRSTPPSPRTPSVTRIPRTDSGHTMPVGWNWTNSMSARSAPAS
jgi:hypothetical protein